MAARRLRVEYLFDDDCSETAPVLARDWGLTPSATPTFTDIRAILGAVHERDPDTIILISVKQYWHVETVPTHPALSKETE